MAEMGSNPSINPDSISFAICRLAMSLGTGCKFHDFPADEEVRRLWYAISAQAMMHGGQGMAFAVAGEEHNHSISDNGEPIS